MRRVRGVGHAKLLLFGEHAAVYGHPAVGLSLAQDTRAELVLDGSGTWRVLPGDAAGLSEQAALRELLGRFEQLLPELRPGGTVRVHSAIPRGLGFGSSAALCVALASALAGEQEAVWRLAHEAERFFHGTPSGIDTGLALLDGLLLFHPAPPGLPRVRRLPRVGLDLVVGAAPRSAESGRLIRGLRDRVEAGDHDVGDRLAGLGCLAAQAAELLERAGGSAVPAGALGELGALASQAQEGLAGLGLSSPDLETLLRQGLTAGALGGKLSGAGGGGAFFLLFDGREQAEEAAVRLRTRALERGLPTARTIRALSTRGGDYGGSRPAHGPLPLDSST